MADGSITACQGIVTVRIIIQRHSFTVRAYVVSMNDSFDLVLGQRWLLEHRAVLDFDRQTLTLKKGNTTCTIRAPKGKVSYEKPEPQRAVRPLSASAVVKHVKGVRIPVLRQTRKPLQHLQHLPNTRRETALKQHARIGSKSNLPIGS
jgi:hypothetical protein